MPYSQLGMASSNVFSCSAGRLVVGLAAMASSWLPAMFCCQGGILLVTKEGQQGLTIMMIPCSRPNRDECQRLGAG